jgi:putative ABC transport system permease protein
MSLVAALGALEIGLVYGLVAIGVFISFRVLNFPDLTVDGSFPLGAAVAAAGILGGIDPYAATLLAIVAGGASGLVTAFLNIRFGILHLLASILTMTALYSINLRIMGSPNLAIIMEPTVISPFELFGLSGGTIKPIFGFVTVAVVGAGVAWYLLTDSGLGMRAAGANPRMARAQGVPTAAMTYFGMALSNALVAFGGALFAQMNGFADITMGTGTIVVGLAAVIAGEAILRPKGIVMAIVACIVGSVIYRFAVQFALNAEFIGMNPGDLNLLTAVLVTIALILPGARNPVKALMKRRGTGAAS